MYCHYRRIIYPTQNAYSRFFYFILFIMATAERVTAHEISDNVIYQRHLVAYNEATRHLRGRVLEVGCGDGYGIPLLAPFADEYYAIDKFAPDPQRFSPAIDNLRMMQMSVPPIGFADDMFDYIVSFQVIEHIEDDKALVREMARVLRPGGKLILTTPNRAMSLTRNPWHVREYSPDELTALLQTHFSSVTMNGVYGNDKVMAYYEQNKQSVARFTRYDIFNLQYKLPRVLLQIPYDLLNRVNRRLLLKGNQQLVSDVAHTDYHISPADATCFDLLAIATK
jgi:SAM-dependent methyltransferase